MNTDGNKDKDASLSKPTSNAEGVVKLRETPLDHALRHANLAAWLMADSRAEAEGNPNHRDGSGDPSDA